MMRNPFFLSLLFACLAMDNVAGQKEEEEDAIPRTLPPFPYFRFKLWSDLSSAALSHAGTLQYDVSTWNLPGTNSIESYAYDSIPTQAMKTAIDGLGFTPEVWDCYINHYRGYDWDELEDIGVQALFETVGWKEDDWGKEDGTIKAEEKLWEKLKDKEREALAQVCYTEELWDDVVFSDWESLPENPNPTAAPASAPTPSQPTGSSPSEPIAGVDEIRYVEWDRLTGQVKSNAALLGYTETTWNLPGMAPIEGYRFTEVNNAFLLDQVGARNNLDVVIAMGYNQERWDCHINHYGGYSWDELDQVGVKVHYRVLGWTQNSWENDPEGLLVPASETTLWDSLSQAQREAAEAVCFQQETWDSVPLQQWEGGSSPTQPSPVAPTAPPVLQPTQPISGVDEIRYVVWDRLTAQIKSNARLLDYNGALWDLPGEAAIEGYRFTEVNEAFFLEQVGVQNNLDVVIAMGYNQEKWDCHINHYGGYSWLGLELAGVQVYYRALGWTQDSWENEGARLPISEITWWLSLSEEEKEAAEAICYRHETWDQIPLQQWNELSEDTILIPEDDDQKLVVGVLILVCFVGIWLFALILYVRCDLDRKSRVRKHKEKKRKRREARRRAGLV